MKAFQKIFAAAFALLLCLGLCAPAFAAEPDTGGEDWDTVARRVLAEYNVSPESIHAGYRNLVTGEEHYINGDDYAVAASMFKVPLCMLAAEERQKGNIDWSVYEQYFTFESVLDDILIDSSNERAYFLCDNFLGGYNEFRLKSAPYMGVEPGSERIELTLYNMYTAREFVNCLSLLCNEPERFPGIIETMQKAMIDRFFKLNEPRFRIAHKPGWIAEDLILNDCAICYTTQPTVLVLFSQGGSTSEEFLSAWCTAMCEYTEKLANRPSPTPEPTPAPTPVPAAAVQTPEPAPAAAAAAPDRIAFPMIVPVAAVCAFLVIGLILIIVLCVRYRARFVGLFLALVLSGLAMMMAVAGVYEGTVYARPSGDPSQSVVRFFDAVCSGNYPAAYSELRDYSDLGLADMPASPAGQRIYNALHESYAYTLTGECRTDKLNAAQPVRMRYLDLPRLEEAVARETQRQAEAIVQSRPISEVYDENRRYRPEIADEAYLAALDVVLRDAPAYYSEAEFELSLAYTDSRWQILASPALLRALAGGIGY